MSNLRPAIRSLLVSFSASIRRYGAGVGPLGGDKWVHHVATGWVHHVATDTHLADPWAAPTEVDRPLARLTIVAEAVVDHGSTDPNARSSSARASSR